MRLTRKIRRRLAREFDERARARGYAKVDPPRAFRELAESRGYAKVDRPGAFRRLAESRGYAKVDRPGAFRRLAESRGYAKVDRPGAFRRLAESRGFARVEPPSAFRRLAESRGFVKAQSRRDLPPGARLSYSQFGEDIVAFTALRGVERGFYVDVGAHHPWKLSNTAMLHTRGWDGINVEPDRTAIEEFERARPQATNLHAAIHNELESVTLHKFVGGRVNTVDAGRAAGLAIHKESVGSETVPALSLNQLWERHVVPEGRHVDYLTIDIEGYDQEALLAFDLDRYGPDVICMELHTYAVTALGDSPMVRYLTSKGYHLFAVNIMSFTFVRRDAAERLGIARLDRSPGEPPADEPEES